MDFQNREILFHLLFQAMKIALRPLQFLVIEDARGAGQLQKPMALLVVELRQIDRRVILQSQCFALDHDFETFKTAAKGFKHIGHDERPKDFR